MRRRRIILILAALILFGIPSLLVVIVLSNGAPLLLPPGPVMRLSRYLSENRIDTRNVNSFPEVSPIKLQGNRKESFDRVMKAVDHLGWKEVKINPEEFTLHAIDKTSLWRFVDDIHIEVIEAEDGYSTIQVRSESRVGQGDLGANLGRYLRFEKTLESVESNGEKSPLRG
ncbi:MAG: DUF1499 domain-containing protein [Candidatus Omnitrophica bacterium]|nr:DUF1499 domain-containing protein [Candidatus Omnitrophota bacterium]MCA9424550.1 DUF1499 domain-containing protein [Candidatus Omnitrophota bacterium]